MWAENRSRDTAGRANAVAKESMMQPNLREEAADICMVCLERFSSVLNDADLEAVSTACRSFVRWCAVMAC